MTLNENSKYQFAKSFTELAIQNNYFEKSKDSADLAKEVTKFFNTVVETICKKDQDK